jgi:hypothetical protein
MKELKRKRILDEDWCIVIVHKEGNKQATGVAMLTPFACYTGCLQQGTGKELVSSALTIQHLAHSFQK